MNSKNQISFFYTISQIFILTFWFTSPSAKAQDSNSSLPISDKTNSSISEKDHSRVDEKQNPFQDVSNPEKYKKPSPKLESKIERNAERSPAEKLWNLDLSIYDKNTKKS